MTEFRTRFINDYKKELIEYIPSGKVDMPVLFDSDDEAEEHCSAINASFHGSLYNKKSNPSDKKLPKSMLGADTLGDYDNKNMEDSMSSPTVMHYKSA
jgi:hypothetical protein